jgi:sterol desaturase/sphingolipid hydroxylase (fatty acid hydroxylase superfamily)
MRGSILIALAIPFFFLFIGVELAVSRALGRRVYRLTDAFGDLGCGIMQQVIGLFYSALLLAGYTWVHERCRLVELRSPALTWVVALVGVDFMYYWWHRASHRVNVLWAAHVVHHQSEDMNLAVALRQAPATSFTVFPFYVILALVVPPKELAVSASINTLYQFWIHTDLIGKLGPIEWVFNTPSHHRGHHGVNPRYIDKNYAGILIVWDRLFGTFEVESEPVVYGTVEQFKSFDPVWAQLHQWVVLARVASAAPRVVDKLTLWLRPPEWAPAGLPPHPAPGPVSPETRRKHEVPISKRVGVYVTLQLALAVAATFLLLLFQASLPRAVTAGAVALVVLGLFAGAALIEGRRWAWPVEVSRLGLAAAGVAALLV